MLRWAVNKEYILCNLKILLENDTQDWECKVAG